jgi:hypothetical protein
MLNSIILNGIRARANVFLKELCTIKRENRGQGAMGEALGGDENVAENVRCRMIKAGQFNDEAAMLAGNKDALQDMYRLSVPYGTDLKTNYRVTLNDLTYDVVRLETELTDEVFHHAIVARRR